MKHSHHKGFTETLANGTRVLVRQTDSDPEKGHVEGESENVVGTLYGVVVPLDSVSALKREDARKHGHEPWYVVRWDRATWESFDSDHLDLICQGEGGCVEVDKDEEYAKIATPEFNAKTVWEKSLAGASKECQDTIVEEGGTHNFTEGLSVELYTAIGMLYSAARSYGLRNFVPHSTANGDISGRVLRLAAQHYAEVLRKAN